MSSYSKYQIVCISGASTINVVELRRDGQVQIKSCAAKAPGRILSFQDDPYLHLGTILLVDTSGKEVEESVDVESCRLFNFSFNASADATVTLYALKMLKFHALLSSTENKCVAADSIFNVMESNKDHFLKPGESDEND